MNDQGYCILVDLDAILDTRLDTLGSIDLTIAQEIATSRAYVEREVDVFPKVDNTVYRDRYLKRNEEVLRLSVMTDIPYQIGLGVRAMLPQMDSGLLGGVIEVHVNMYPYKLSDEIKRLICVGMKQYIPDPIQVKPVWSDMYGLTPGSLKSKYNEWYAYDVDQWLGIHQKTLLTGTLKNFMITLPRISTTGTVPESPDIDPFSAKELILSEFVKCVHISSSYFSYNSDMTEHLANQSRSSIHSSGDKGTSP